jgi:thioredoxin-like negative regulator of GroEL
VRISRRQLRYLIEQQVTKVIVMSDEDKKKLDDEKGDVEAEKERIATKLASQEEDGPSKEDIKAAITERLEKIGFYKKYSYGLDDIPDKTKAHDAIIGHT